jgi:ribonuclease BN (tRNA processing enzyme)
VLVFDAQYTFHESLTDKITWGHSSASIAIDIASKYKVKKLVLFHHDPNYSDEKLNSVISNARSYMNVNRKPGDTLEIDLAHEGMVFEI